MGKWAARAAWRLYDMHCHLDRMADAEATAADARELGLALLCCPIDPAGTLDARERLATEPNVRVAAGLHPWWVADAADLEGLVAHAVALASRSRFVGEVGLDFSPRFAATKARQLAAFEAVVAGLAEHPVARRGRVLSVHAVRAAGAALDILERYDLTRQARCVFHWFSGSGEELARVRALDCYFSVGERMLATRRGRAYAAQVPEDRLLLETDYPVQLDTLCPAAQIAASLERVLDLLAEARGTDRTALAARIAQTSAELFG